MDAAPQPIAILPSFRLSHPAVHAVMHLALDLASKQTKLRDENRALTKHQVRVVPGVTLQLDLIAAIGYLVKPQVGPPTAAWHLTGPAANTWCSHMIGA